MAVDPRRDHRGSPIPTGAMIATRFMELRKRRGLMITLVAVTIGFPTVFLAVRLLLHAVAPKTYGPAGGYNIYTALSAGVLYTFGFIVAATLGCTAGSVDLTEGMFRHLVITGRSRLALYLARIPAGLAIIVSLVAIGFTIVCAVCVFAAPSKLSYNGVTVPAGLSQSRPGELGRRQPHRSPLQLRLRPTIKSGRRLRQLARPTGARRHRRTRRGSPSRPPPPRPRPRPSRSPTRTTPTTRSSSSPVELPDDQDRVVARTRSDDRVHRRPRARLAARPTHRRR